MDTRRQVVLLIIVLVAAALGSAVAHAQVDQSALAAQIRPLISTICENAAEKLPALGFVVTS